MGPSPSKIEELEEKNAALRRKLENQEYQRKAEFEELKRERREAEERHHQMMQRFEQMRREELRSMRQNFEDMNRSLLSKLEENEKKTQDLLERYNENNRIFKTTVAQTKIIIQNIINSNSNLDEDSFKSLNKLLEMQSLLQKKDDNYF